MHHGKLEEEFLEIASDYSEGEEAEWRVGRALDWVFWAEEQLNQAITNMRELHSASKKISELGPLNIEEVIYGILEDGSDDQPAEHSMLIRRYKQAKKQNYACGSKKKFSTNRAKGYLCKKNFAQKIKIPKAKLEEWADMTNENEHTLVGASIADFLAQYDTNYKKYSDFFNLIEKHSDKEGHLAYPGGWVRPLLYQKLYEDIEYDFGKEILAQIKSAL